MLLAAEYCDQISSSSSSKKNIIDFVNCLCIDIYIASLSNFTTDYSIAERLAATLCPLPAAEEAGRTQTSPHLCVCAAVAAASVVHLTRCLGQVWSLHSHCLVPFSSFLTGWATAGFKKPRK